MKLRDFNPFDPKHLQAIDFDHLDATVDLVNLAATTDASDLDRAQVEIAAQGRVVRALVDLGSGRFLALLLLLREDATAFGSRPALRYVLEVLSHSGHELREELNGAADRAKTARDRRNAEKIVDRCRSACEALTDLENSLYLSLDPVSPLPASSVDCAFCCRFELA